MLRHYCQPTKYKAKVINNNFRITIAIKSGWLIGKTIIFINNLNNNNIITVQELINALNKIEDKSKDVLHSDYLYVREIEEQDYYIILY